VLALLLLVLGVVAVVAMQLAERDDKTAHTLHGNTLHMRAVLWHHHQRPRAQVFDAFDVDGDSVISSAELVAQLGGAAQLGWSELGGGAVEAAGAPAALRCLLRQADTDGDGVISFEEFASVVEVSACGERGDG
jgi:hypothetical protein